MQGAVMVVERERGPVFYGKWRDSTGRQVKRRLGPAWVGRRGRVPTGSPDERGAVVALAAAVEQHEAALLKPRVDRTVTFADAAAMWLGHLEHVEGAKPSTLADYRYMLTPVNELPRKRGHRPSARIMRAFGSRPLAGIMTADATRFLRALDVEPGVTPRTVNKHRQLLCSVFKQAIRSSCRRTPPRRRTSGASRTRFRSTSTSRRRSSPSHARRARSSP